MSELDAKADLGIEVEVGAVVVENANPATEPETTPPVAAESNETKPEDGKGEVKEDAVKEPENVELNEDPENNSPDKEGKLFAKQRIKYKEKLNAERSARLALEAELQSLRTTQPQPAQADNAPKAENFQTLEEYYIALGRYGAQQELTEQQAKRQEYENTLTANQRAAEFKELVADKLEEATKEFDDFKEVMEDGEDELSAILDAPAYDLRSAIVESDNFAKLAYFFAKKPAELKKISAMPERKAIAELTRLGDKLAAKTPSKPSAAPPPVRPTNGTGGVDAPIETLKGEALRARMEKLKIL